MPNPLHDTLFAPHEDSDRPFLLRADGSVVLNHRQFASLSARLAAALASEGLAPGDRLVMQVEKSPEALALYAGCIRAGVVFLPLNTTYTASEVSYFLSDSGARLMIADAGKAAALSEVAGPTRVMTLEALTDLARGLAPAPAASRTEGDLAALLYTSGTTGRSKGAMLSHANLLSNARTLTEHWRFTAGDVLIHALPIFHTHGLFVATNISLLAGSGMIFLPKFDADAIISALPHATAMMGVPTFYTRLLNDDRLTRGACAGMRLFVSGSAPLLAEIHAAFEARTGHAILERYGMTETNMNTSNPYDGARKPGTVGPPLPDVELKVTDPVTGEAMPTCETGMIEVRGPNVFQGYWQMPEKTAQELRPDGFFITGDLGFVGDDGYVRIVGRAKDLIISGGFNVYPKEVEDVLDQAPGVLESAVVGVPHADFGEAVLAVIVARPGESVDEAALRAHADAHLAKFKQPKSLILLDELPRNTMGKVQKNVLRERFADTFADS